MARAPVELGMAENASCLKHAAGFALDANACFVRDCARQNKAAVVVGVLADQIYPAGRARNGSPHGLVFSTLAVAVLFIGNLWRPTMRIPARRAAR